MKVEKIISDLVRPLVLSGAYKDETVALKDIVVTCLLYTSPSPRD